MAIACIVFWGTLKYGFLNASARLGGFSVTVQQELIRMLSFRFHNVLRKRDGNI